MQEFDTVDGRRVMRTPRTESGCCYGTRRTPRFRHGATLSAFGCAKCINPNVHGPNLRVSYNSIPARLEINDAVDEVEAELLRRAVLSRVVWRPRRRRTRSLPSRCRKRRRVLRAPRDGQAEEPGTDRGSTFTATVHDHRERLDAMSRRWTKPPPVISGNTSTNIVYARHHIRASVAAREAEELERRA
jgi:hypothetical protein